MKEENLRRLMDCEKLAKSMVEEARQEIVRMKNQARIDAQPIINEINRVESMRLEMAEKSLQSDLKTAKNNMEKEIDKAILELNGQVGNLEDISDFIASKVTDSNK